MVVAGRGGAVGSCHTMGTKFQLGKMNKFWRSSGHHCVHS